MPGSRKEHPGGKKKAMEVRKDLYMLTFSNRGPTGYVNLLLNIKVISL
jgi:hypothetical protein